MTVITESRIISVVRAAEAVLSQRAGSAVRLADPEDLGGSGRTVVVRARVTQNPVSMDRSLVIKALPADEDTRAFYREVASYKYATALPSESRPGPQLIAWSPDVRLIVLADLGNGRPMTAMLSGTDPVETSRAISAWGQALGRLHTATVGGEGDFMALLRHGGAAADDVDVLAEATSSAALSAPAVLDSIGVGLPTAIAEKLGVASALFGAGDHRAFSPSDVGPENILLNDEGVQFMDYEWGGFRDATLDIAYALVTMRAQLSMPNLVDRAELEVSMIDAWRSEVTAIWPALRHDGELAQKLIAARLAWVWLSTVWMLPDLDAPDSASGGYAANTHDWALHSNDPRVIVARWSDLASAAHRAGDTTTADFATDVELALQRTWLS